MLWPNGTKNQPRLTSKYGPRESFNTSAGATLPFHSGADFAGIGEIKAVAAGTVTHAGLHASYGQRVIIQHDGYRSLSAHMQTGSLRVKVGDRVAEGQVLGIEGATGKVTGPHLHLEIILPDGSTTDPVPFITNRLTESEREDDMAFILKSPGGKTWYLINGKTAITLGRGSNPKNMPEVNAPDEWAMQQFKKSGITGLK